MFPEVVIGRDFIFVVHQHDLFLITNILEGHAVDDLHAAVCSGVALGVTCWLYTHSVRGSSVEALITNRVSMTETATQVQTIFALVETILQFFLAERVSEGLKICKLADSVGIKLINTSKCLLPNRLLIVSEQEAPELFPLEEVFAVIFWLGHG